MPQTSDPRRLRLVFAGTPDFAARHLSTLIDSDHELVGVYTQPDRPRGRGKQSQPGPVKQLALDAGLPVYQPASLKSDDARAELAALDADLMVVVAYGLLLPPAILDTPRLGCINVHASLLPRWRGAAPIQRAIEAGDRETGVTIMQMEAGLDTGPMLVKQRCPIGPEDTAGDLHDRLAGLGAEALQTALAQLAAGTARPEPQSEQERCYAPKLTKAEAALDWRRPAVELARQIRAFNPFPVCHTRPATGGDPIRIRAAEVVAEDAASAPGTLTRVGPNAIQVACGNGQLALTNLQLPGKRAMPVADLLRGRGELFRVGEAFAPAEPGA